MDGVYMSYQVLPFFPIFKFAHIAGLAMRKTLPFLVLESIRFFVC